MPFFPPRVVCIDPGHPSEVGRGTEGRHVTELHANWEIALSLRDELEKAGVKVVLTKSKESEFVRNRRRAEIGNESHADLVVRLHCDAGNGTGITTYVPTQQGRSEGKRGPSREVVSASDEKAKLFHERLVADLKGILQDNGLKGDQYTAVGRKQGALTGSIFSTRPVLLVEMVVLTNRHDEQFIESAAGRKKLTHALADATLAAIEGR